MAEKLWGGAFSVPPDEEIIRYTSSLSCDRRLARYDIEGSVAHVRMLGECGIIPKEEAETIARGLLEIGEGLKDGSLSLDPEAEDVHSAIEALLTERIGEAGKSIHAARSRNDQVATDERLYTRGSIDALDAAARKLQTALVTAAGANSDVIMPGYTHMRHGQPVLFAHHLLAYVEMLSRDRERLGDCRRRVNVLPLGSGAVAGTSLPIDRDYTAELLGFDGVSRNSIDAVGDRDFIVEVLSAIALLFVHLSRMCEELILWSTKEFGFISFDESLCTGSSMMPQKVNPDGLELARGKSGVAFGSLVAMLSIMKSLPLSYNRDMQEDKRPLFEAVDAALSSLDVAARYVSGMRLDPEALQAAIEGDYSEATDIAEYLVAKGERFREAHRIVGEITRYCRESEKLFEDLSQEEWRDFSGLFEDDIGSVVAPGESVERKASQGSTAPPLVRKEIEAWLKRL